MRAMTAVLVPLAVFVFVDSDLKRVGKQKGLPSRRRRARIFRGTLPAFSARATSAPTMLTRVLRLGARRSATCSSPKKHFRSVHYGFAHSNHLSTPRAVPQRSALGRRGDLRRRSATPSMCI